jgi:regulator of protease activity HflC (stomatin/prohibitin superfamily)
LESALAWIGKIFEWIGAFIPRWAIIDTTSGAIKYVGGKRVVVCGPGIHWYWPARTTFVEHPTARQTDRLETQAMESRDGKTFIVSGTITYTVDDLAALIPTTFSPFHTIVDLAMAAVHDVCCEMDWADLQAMQRRGTIKTQLKNEAQKQLKDYGINVIKLQLNSLSRCRAIRLSQSTSTEEN